VDGNAIRRGARFVLPDGSINSREWKIRQTGRQIMLRWRRPAEGSLANGRRPGTLSDIHAYHALFENGFDSKKGQSP